MFTVFRSRSFGVEHFCSKDGEAQVFYGVVKRHLFCSRFLGRPLGYCVLFPYGIKRIFEALEGQPRLSVALNAQFGFDGEMSFRVAYACFMGF